MSADEPAGEPAGGHRCRRCGGVGERDWAVVVLVTELGFPVDVALGWTAAEADRRAGRGPAGLEG